MINRVTPGFSRTLNTRIKALARALPLASTLVAIVLLGSTLYDANQSHGNNLSRLISRGESKRRIKATAAINPAIAISISTARVCGNMNGIT